MWRFASVTMIFPYLQECKLRDNMVEVVAETRSVNTVFESRLQ